MLEKSEVPWMERLIANSPLRALQFLVVCGVGVACIVLDLYLLHKYRRMLSANDFIYLGVLIGIQWVGQFGVAMNCYSRIRDLLSSHNEKGGEPSIPLQEALQVAERGMTNVLFFSFGTSLLMLHYVGVLFARLGATVGSR